MANPLDLLRGIKNLRGLTLRERGMLWLLAWYGNPDGTNIHPSNARLAEDAELDVSNIKRLLAKLRDMGILVKDGKHGYVDKYKLIIPGITPGISPAALEADISQEEWESQWLPESDESPVTSGGISATIQDDDDATQRRLPVVKPPPAAPTIPDTPPGPTPEEKLQRDLELLREALNLTKRGIMTHEQFMRGGRRKGFSDDYLNWMFNGGGGETDSPGSQPERESESVNFPQTRSMYQP